MTTTVTVTTHAWQAQVSLTTKLEGEQGHELSTTEHTIEPRSQGVYHCSPGTTIEVTELAPPPEVISPAAEEASEVIPPEAQ